MASNPESPLSKNKYKRNARDCKIHILLCAKILGTIKVKGEFGSLTDCYCEVRVRPKGDRFGKKYISGRSTAKRIHSEAQKHGNTIAPFPRIFNPFYQKIDEYEKQLSISSGSSIKPRKWAPLNLEIFHALHFILAAWTHQNPSKRNAEGSIGRMLETVLKYSSSPQITMVKSINTLLSRDRQGRTLEQIITHLRVQDPKIKPFNFPLLNERLQELRNID